MFLTTSIRHLVISAKEVTSSQATFGSFMYFLLSLASTAALLLLEIFIFCIVCGTYGFTNAVFYLGLRAAIEGIIRAMIHAI